MSNLEMAFKDIGKDHITVINCDDIIAVDVHSVYMHNEGASYSINDFSSSFIRYPYDLIPPHSETYELREETEFHKTLSLILDGVSINHLASTWMLRNRAFSLSQALAFGVNIAEYNIIKKGSALPSNERKAIKALGNCFVSHNNNSLCPDIKEFFRIEEDDGDIATIFPSSSFDVHSIEKYLSIIKVAFLQREIQAINEYRGYIIGEVFFVYVRDQVNTFDKSTAKYISTNYKCSNKTILGLRRLMGKFSLKYLCFDFLSDANDEEIVIDINPYGSMPNYLQYPEPSLQLAKIMIGEVKNEV